MEGTGHPHGGGGLAKSEAGLPLCLGLDEYASVSLAVGPECDQ